LGDSASALFKIVQLAMVDNMNVSHNCVAFVSQQKYVLLFHGIPLSVFIGLVLSLSVFSWNSTPVELILVLLEVRH